MYFRAVVIARTHTGCVCVCTYIQRANGRGIYVNVVHARVSERNGIGAEPESESVRARVRYGGE